MEYKKAKENLEILVENFDNHINEYKKGNYNETLTRRDFIDPFLSSLGWDVDNKLNLPGSYREVIHEDKLLIEDSSRAPDYCITINGNKKFYVEAKKPSVSLKDSISAAYQLRRYGWSAKMPISIITDFEEFSIYDCQVRPNADDKASIARINYFTYQDYIKEFDFLWETFSKEMVKNGSLEKYFQSTKGKRASTSVDDEFLKSLDSWRDLLAKNLVFKNPSINEDQLNFSLQKIIDRIIFLRISEDRGVEDQNQLLKSIGNNTYNNLKTLFHLADRKYNSGLFDFKKDEITDSLIIDDNILGQIIEEMYYPKSPYEFSVIPVEILGHSYEQYLGKTITIETNHAIKIEEKPEVRKAGGVYYTPQYIVDYIVKNTVGKLVEDKKPEEVAKLKICDPACGSGSFLLGAYQYLLNWHREYYINSKNKNISKYLKPDGNLTTSLKKEILLNNIFGVDIDTNAVEVTKLSLMLKAMEGETKASINYQLSAFHDRVLPTLDKNIKSGNSLIDMDFYESQIDFEPAAEKKIKPFSWEQAFPDVFKQGGFDAVIGNPPYLNLTVSMIENSVLNYYSKKYRTIINASSKNLFQLFIERCINLKPQMLSFIIPESLLNTTSNSDTRDLILNNYNLRKIAYFDHFVFQDATIGTSIIVLNKSQQSETSVEFIDKYSNIEKRGNLILKKSKLSWDIKSNDNDNQFFDKINQNSILMNDLVTMSKGMAVKDRNNFLFDEFQQGSLPFVLGKNMNRYKLFYDKYANYNDLNIVGGTRDYNKHISTPRLLIRRTGNIVCATYSNNPELIESTVYILKTEKLNYFYLLGLLNSKLITYYLSKKLVTNAQGFPQILMGQLEQLPIPQNPAPETQNQIIKLVETMLQLNKDLQTASLPEKKEQIQQRIIYTDKKIDQLVYQLYDLTEEEIKVVEGE